MPTLPKSVMVYSLAVDHQGYTELVRCLVPRKSQDDDLSMDVATAERKLTATGYTVLGSFLETDPAAKLVNLDACKLVK